MHGHKSQRLFYLTVTDFVVEADVDSEPTTMYTDTPMISLHTILGIRT